MLLREAVAIEDGIPYNEPPVWHHPPRQILGALLLEAGKAGDAEKVYLEDLRRFPENGWSLFGLTQSLDAQGRRDEARAVQARFEKAWARADITLTSSRVLSSGAPVTKGTAAHVPAVKSVTLADRGVTLQYVEQGDPSGVPLILLHGVTDSWRSFEPLLPHLAPSFRAFAITQRDRERPISPRSGPQCRRRWPLARVLSVDKHVRVLYLDQHGRVLCVTSTLECFA